MPLVLWVVRQVQTVLHSLPAPYVWGVSPTESSNVTPLLSGMGPTKLLPNVYGVNCCYAKTTNPSVPIGNTKEVAPANIMTNDIFALDVVRSVMELRHVLELRGFNALTPYRPDAWERLLS